MLANRVGKKKEGISSILFYSSAAMEILYDFPSNGA